MGSRRTSSDPYAACQTSAVSTSHEEERTRVIMATRWVGSLVAHAGLGISPLSSPKVQADSRGAAREPGLCWSGLSGLQSERACVVLLLPHSSLAFHSLEVVGRWWRLRPRTRRRRGSGLGGLHQGWFLRPRLEAEVRRWWQGGDVCWYGVRRESECSSYPFSQCEYRIQSGWHEGVRLAALPFS